MTTHSCSRRETLPMTKRVGHVSRSVRIEVPLYERLEEAARAKGESINACIVQAVKLWIAHQGRK
jgi:predicted HicB family RNase H-like nuclease